MLRHVYQLLLSVTDEFFNSNTSRIGGVGEGDNQNRGCTCTLHSDCLHHQHTVQNNQAPSSSGKRPRTDDDPKKTKLNVWQHFTRIYIKVPKEAGSKSKKDGKKLIYAVCNYCDKVFKADSKQGTSHHGRHAESCLRKHSQPSSSKSCSQDIPLILEAREIVSAGGCGSSGMLCV